jgi:hypothetical protein
MKGESHAKHNNQKNKQRIFRSVPRGGQIMDLYHLTFTTEQMLMLVSILEKVDVYEMTVGEYMTFAMIVAKLENSDLELQTGNGNIKDVIIGELQ